MTTAKNNELAALKIHEKAFADSIKAREESGDAHPAVIGDERVNLSNIRRKIAAIEKGEAVTEPAPTSEPEQK